MDHVRVTRHASKDALEPRASRMARGRVAVITSALALTACSTALSRDNTAPGDNSTSLPAAIPRQDDATSKNKAAIDTLNTGPSESDGSSAEMPLPKLPPLSSDQEIVALDVPGFRTAAVALPIGATARRPIVVALHGNFDRPEWQCEVWRRVTRGNVFVLCPRGIPRLDAPRSLNRWTYGKTTAVRAEIDAALTALQQRFASHLDEGPLLYVGFSLGAILGTGIVSDDAERFPRALLIEGGHSGWSSARAKAFAAGGGKRVLFACGQRACMNDALAPEKLLSVAGVDVRRIFGGEAGHTYDGPVAAEIERAWAWLVTGDPRFAR